MSKRILLSYPDHPNIERIVKTIAEIKAGKDFEDGKLKGFREYLMQAQILSQTPEGHDELNGQNLSYLLHYDILPIWEKVHDPYPSVNEGLRFKQDFPNGFPVEVNYDWLQPIVDAFTNFKPDFILFYSGESETLTGLLQEKFEKKGHKIGRLFASPQTVQCGSFYKRDKDRKIRYDFSMNGDETIKGKTGILATVYLTETETIGFMRAAKNAGGNLISACAIFSINDFRPDYALTLEHLNLKQE